MKLNIQQKNIVKSINTFRCCRLLFYQMQINPSIIWSQREEHKDDERGIEKWEKLELRIPVEGAPSLTFWWLNNNPKIVKWQSSSHEISDSVHWKLNLHNYRFITHAGILIIIRAITRACDLYGLSYKSYYLPGRW